MSSSAPRSRARRHRALVGGSVVVLLPFPAALTACGGAGGSVDAATAQQQLVAVADLVDACYAKRNDTRQCTDEQALGELGDAKLGDGTGEVHVSASKPTRYQVTMKVDDRTSFAILVQPVGARKRVCTPAGAGGCPKGGMW